MKNLNDMTSKELKEMGKNLHISGWWKMKKEDLILTISSMTEEEKIKAKEEKEKEDKLFEHYQKNWSKYGPKNDWVKFLEKYKKGKINLIEDLRETKDLEKIENNIEEITLSNEPEKSKASDVSDTSDKLAKTNIIKSGVKKPSLKIKELTFNGKTQTIKEWAAELNMPWPTLYDRINRNGWTIERALTTPVRKKLY